MMQKHREVRWVIVGKYGLYVGQWDRRCDAIAQHVHDKFDGSPECGVVSQWPGNRGRLSESQRLAWGRCRALGDYVTRAEIIWWST